MVFIYYYKAGTDRKLSVSKKVIKSTACMISKDLVKTNKIQDGRRKKRYISFEMKQTSRIYGISNIYNMIAGVINKVRSDWFKPSSQDKVA